MRWNRIFPPFRREGDVNHITNTANTKIYIVIIHKKITHLTKGRSRQKPKHFHPKDTKPHFMPCTYRRPEPSCLAGSTEFATGGPNRLLNLEQVSASLVSGNPLRRRGSAHSPSVGGACGSEEGKEGGRRGRG